MRAWKPLPSAIDWIEYAVKEHARPAVSLTVGEMTNRPGATRLGGAADRPVDASWSPGHEESYHDGDCLILQLNLAEIPPAVRREGWPAVGMIWVFLNLSDDWTVRVEFDPRRVEDIPWPATRALARGVKWDAFLCPPTTDENRLPEIYFVPANDSPYWEWWQDQRPRDGVQIGGWISPIQGLHGGDDDTLVAEFNNLHFGDCGAVYLHFDAKTHRWWGFAQTC